MTTPDVPAGAGSAADPGEVIAELRGQIEHYDAGRYPVQHATARFHLGVALIRTGDVDEAVSSLRRAVELFPAEGMPVEHAKASNMLGVALRERGSHEAAAEIFDRAAGLFASEGQLVETAAARHNRGLVLRQLGQEDQAATSFRAARDTFADAGALAQASAAGRELGALLLDHDRIPEAVDVLEQAVEDAADAADQAGLGAAANALGLAHLAAGRLEQARASFEESSGANPRSVRPAAYAMARANMALAADRAADAPRARLHARQALATPGVPPPVRDQAADIMRRRGDPAGDLMAVLDDEPQERWTGIIREELRRLQDEDRAVRDRELGAWVEGQVARDDQAIELAEALLDILLEQPPEVMETMIRGVVAATGRQPGDGAGRFRAATARAMARFHVPQLMRLRDTFERIAGELDEPRDWS